MTETLHEMSFAQGRIRWRELGQGPPLVLLHGWSMSHAVFAELADLLATDFHLLIPDLPGHGGSTPSIPCRLEVVAGALKGWLEQRALEPVSLLGWSLGGQVALQLAVIAPQLIERLLLVATTPRFCGGDDWTAGLPPAELRILRRGLQRRYLATLGEFFDRQFGDELFEAERRREILQFAVRPVGPPEAEAALETLDLLGHEDLRSALASITQPALVIHGEQDPIIPWAAGRYLADHLPQARLVSLPGIGHAPFLSRPRETAKLVAEFCR